jgi:hypothetical protein
LQESQCADLGPIKILLKSISLAGLTILTIFPTRVSTTSATCVDFIVVLLNKLECPEYSVIVNASSDYFPVQAVFGASTATKPQPVVKRSYKDTALSELRQNAANIVPANSLLAGTSQSYLNRCCCQRQFIRCRPSFWTTSWSRGSTRPSSVLRLEEGAKNHLRFTP